MNNSDSKGMENRVVSDQPYEPPAATFVSLKLQEREIRNSLAPNCRDCDDRDTQFLR
jgi:hypothetical protein